ncbi:Alkyl hydroperoxide reductase E [Austwickia sp. TVS 96-490-7B]|uniref:peroxiredoxin n=1 Tax=Austwickia sp. TVS 96-490-7B TaxID=2830843 RepID=UPI001C5A1B10|nr:peroxiredoxin [Austwickia sp. TVS 96-490-7B]MBW3086432.1 Alkyl hydroperoxide reductase E [Austwickia sp. TVS 96-490-7B]
MTSGVVSPGDWAPEFVLSDQYGRVMHSSVLIAQRPLLVVFFPFAFSGICTGELRELRDERERFDHPGVHFVAISCDPMYALRAWDDAEGFFFPLLSDFWPHGEVARRYGVFDDQDGAARRGTFLIGQDGKIFWSLMEDRGTARDFSGVDAAVAALAS